VINEPVLELFQAELTYPGHPPIHVLKGIDLVVQRGEYVTLVGPSGAGKSTFLNVVGLLDSLTSGRYSLAGWDTGELSDRERTALRGPSIGFVFQSFHLMEHRTATENVELALLYNGSPRAARRDLARQALSRVGLQHRLDALPSRMSGGERQRIAIARAVVGDPEILLCDEPTGNLDSVTAASVMKLIDELHNLGLTIIVITHDPAIAERGQRRLEIADGVILEPQKPALKGNQ